MELIGIQELFPLHSEELSGAHAIFFKSVSVRWPLSAMTTLMQQKEKVNICELVWKTITYEHLQRSRLKKKGYLAIAKQKTIITGSR